MLTVDTNMDSYNDSNKKITEKQNKNNNNNSIKNIETPNENDKQKIKKMIKGNK